MDKNRYTSFCIVLLSLVLLSSCEKDPKPLKIELIENAVTDVDGNSYNAVKIGDQVWMKENLRTTKYADGTTITLGTTTSISTAYRYYPDNNSANVSNYGYLYNWPAVMHGASSSDSNPSGVQGICPDGWHVPSDAEWTQLTNYVEVNNPSYKNATGFSVLPAGYCYYGYYYNFGSRAYFWSATESNDFSAYYRYFYYDDAGVGRNTNNKAIGGLSVRCVRN